MTIAAGFVCLDGIVLAADSEYTSNYSSYEGEKLFQFATDNWAIGIAAAGTMDLAIMFIDELRRDLRMFDNLESLHKAIVKLAGCFNEEHIRNSDDQTRQVLLLVAIQMKTSDENLLLKVNGDVVTPVYNSDFIGVGDEIARATASWLFHPHLPTKVAANIALHIVHWTTQHAQYCGKGIYALTVPRPWKQQSSFSMFEITEFFWGLNGLLQPILIGCLNATIGQEHFDASLKAFEEKMRAVRRDTIRANAPFPVINPSSPTEPGQQS